MKILDYILWDLDGTLLDDSMRHYRCYCDIVDHYGGKCISFEEYWIDKRNTIKRTVLLEKSEFQGTYQQYMDSWNELIEEDRYLNFEILKPDTLKVLDWISSVSAHVYLVTMRQKRDNLLRQLKRLRINRYFERIITGNPNTCKKSDLLDLHLDNKSFVIGDTESDLELANSLGCNFIAVTTGLRDRKYFNNSPCIEKLSDLNVLIQNSTLM